jgi:hypothetical protein
VIINPSLPSGHTIFCDDIRHEITGKITYVGTYGTHLFTPQFPVTIPKLCCAITFREEPTSLDKVTIKILQEIDKNETLLSELTYDIPSNLPPFVATGDSAPFVAREAKFYVEMGNIVFEGVGKLKVRAFRGDDEIRLGALQIEGADVLEANDEFRKNDFH